MTVTVAVTAGPGIPGVRHWDKLFRGGKRNRLYFGQFALVRAVDILGSGLTWFLDGVLFRLLMIYVTRDHSFFEDVSILGGLGVCVPCVISQSRHQSARRWSYRRRLGSLLTVCLPCSVCDVKCSSAITDFPLFDHFFSF